MTQSSSTTDDPVYFWRDGDTETGWLSQWYYCPFTDDKNPKIVYNTAEHYMMYHKALLFNDQAVADQVLAAGHPRNVKALGRKVQNFSDETWKKHRTVIVRQGNLLKFTAAVTEKGFRKGTGNNAPLIDGSLREMLLATGSREMLLATGSREMLLATGSREMLLATGSREMLLATGSREIVEASPSDKIWGIGCLAADAERRRAYWGLNLLGKALMEVRSLLREQTPQT